MIKILGCKTLFVEDVNECANSYKFKEWSDNDLKKIRTTKQM